jgi:cobalt/nickel transport system permease protein
LTPARFYALFSKTRIRFSSRHLDLTPMHLPDILSPPVAASTGVLAVVGLGYCLRRLERGLGERTTVLMGMVSAFVFAAQMVNFPVGPGVSGHLLGGVLAAVILGPWGGAGVIAAVLIVQCLLFADGGLTALGANFLNMGLIGAVGGYAVYAPLRRAIGGRNGVLLGAMAAAWVSVVVSAGACAFELAASAGLSQLPRLLGWMALVHAAIGAGEAIITGLVLRFVLLVRPDLIYQPDTLEPGRLAGWWQVAAAGVGVALAVVVFLAPLASTSPDGLEFVGGKLHVLDGEAPAVLTAPLAEYGQSLGMATALAGLIGTLVVFGVGLVLARAFSGPAAKAGPTPEVVAHHDA